MATTTTPNWTRGAAGNVKSSASLGAGATGNVDVDYSAVVRAKLSVKNTPGTIAATKGVRIDIYDRYGSGPTTSIQPVQTWTLPSDVASTAEDLTIWLPPGNYNVKWTNLDATNAVTLEITGDTMVLTTA